MADDRIREQTIGETQTGDQPENVPLEEPLPSTNDPGGARSKGYSAEQRPKADVKKEGPLPLVPGHDTGSEVQQPERDGKVQPTGRSEPGAYTPNDRLMGSDR